MRHRASRPADRSTPFDDGRDGDGADRDAGAGVAGELVEWVDEHDRVLAIVSRGRMRAENLRHRSVAIIVTSSDGRLLVHQRAATKDLRPSWWDLAAGGVRGVGESADAAARRELAEELGIDGRPRWIARAAHDDVDSRELCEIFGIVHDGPYRFADGEVTHAELVTPAAFAELVTRVPFLPGSLAMVLPHVDGFDLPPGAIGR